MPKGAGGKKVSERVSPKYSNEMKGTLLTLEQSKGPSKEKPDKKRGVIAKDEEFIKKSEIDSNAVEPSTSVE